MKVKIQSDKKLLTLFPKIGFMWDWSSSIVGGQKWNTLSKTEKMKFVKKEYFKDPSFKRFTINELDLYLDSVLYLYHYKFNPDFDESMELKMIQLYEQVGKFNWIRTKDDLKIPVPPQISSSELLSEKYSNRISPQLCRDVEYYSSYFNV